MHELAVTQSVLDSALKHAGLAGARKITQVNLCRGELSHEQEESIQFYWEMIAKGTAAEGAQLRFRRIPARYQCTVCYGEYSYPQGEARCQYCGSTDIRVVAGEEFCVESIDVDT